MEMIVISNKGDTGAASGRRGPKGVLPMDADADADAAADMRTEFESAATEFRPARLSWDPMYAAFAEIAAPATAQRVLDTLTVTSMPSTSVVGAGVTS
ncbi:hypothetical protein TUM20985_40200 [Mycobacterium antarcticum]|nr:hypothetical protein TUM20985_40200 [Mycolicibacterium sp. TUM20985]GLP82916.1 hypothetical protein TUM20984_43360 [Mycolicibacterium sp. TUM20984]